MFKFIFILKIIEEWTGTKEMIGYFCAVPFWSNCSVLFGCNVLESDIGWLSAAQDFETPENPKITVQYTAWQGTR
jgi:hypothetical protein